MPRYARMGPGVVKGGKGSAHPSCAQIGLGTLRGQMAVAYQVVGDATKAATLVGVLESAQMPNGAIPAASADRLTTGFDWAYFHRGHIGATAWYGFAKLGVNPFWLE